MKHGFGHRAAEGAEAAEGCWLRVSRTSASQLASHRLDWVGLTWTWFDWAVFFKNNMLILLILLFLLNTGICAGEVASCWLARQAAIVATSCRHPGCYEVNGVEHAGKGARWRRIALCYGMTGFHHGAKGALCGFNMQW